ncbi:NAD(P)H-binding protein [Streptomyces sp. VRA16 Mangrove soil]|uniref:NAD(P)H-binding protein n=1 Tax=Streptomyces sp. VRA16 Mangrove soil TaxID=2817434 RepID=UPI001A9D9A04|nr:NAD(P)H-binding protein [Streptomyces sp. VRA16 Mangrove soil]MBO1333821.1 NAD(P)H-binding protein [Streptomyces sp. VRA16 Mangrove soil]
MLLVTGASGGLGSLIAERLKGRDDVVLGTREPKAPGGRRVDFDAPHTLADAFDGVRTLLLISAGYGEDDTVIARHEAALTAAEKAGVEHVVYTSLSGDGDHLPYALAHRWTERRLRESPLAWTVLRNGLYAELLSFLAAPGPDGVISAPLGTGRLAAVARDDLAEIAARVALAPAPHAGRTYELVGEVPLGGAELARATGTAYVPGTLAEARERIAESGAVPFQVPMLVGTYSAIAAGFMDGSGVPEAERGTLRELLGREPRDPARVYAETLAG